MAGNGGGGLNGGNDDLKSGIDHYGNSKRINGGSLNGAVGEIDIDSGENRLIASVDDESGEGAGERLEMGGAKDYKGMRGGNGGDGKNGGGEMANKRYMKFGKRYMRFGKRLYVENRDD